MNTLRQNAISNACSETQDCLVVGAGINGAVAAASLTGRGAKVTVVDKADFASFTSQESSNLAWGGIKYLESYEFGLVWKLCRCRNQLMKAYPGQVREIRFFTSITKGFRKPRIVLYLGALLYWFMGRCQTRPPRLLSRKTIRREAPMVNTSHLIGGLEYSDCHLVENDTRFAFGFIRKVLKAGGSAINYMELIAADWRDGYWHCTLRDHVSGEAVGLQTKTIVNAAGPYADRVNVLLGIESTFKHIFSKGAHIIVPQVTKTEHVLTFFASDGRLFFMVPMGNRTCIGTTDTRVDNAAAQPTSDDVEFLLANANALLDLKQPLTKNDVIATRCGVRPLVVRKTDEIGNAEWMALSRKHEIDVDAERKMCSVYGGKLTDCLNVGNEITEIIESFGVALNQTTRWFGEDSAQDETDSGEPVIGPIGRRPIQRMAESEMVVQLEDFLRRRTMLELTMGREALRTDPGLREAADILFGEKAGAELERYLR
ncbi:MAG: FAD-dependent oxidoreductase [Deltaproteobacteria bacterium]|nr:FAD-dependent oxidoreductase [Deltaproteobacteria bacterium]